MQKLHTKPKPTSRPELQPKSQLQLQSRRPQPVRSRNLKPNPTSEKPTIFIRHGILEHDGSYCTFYENADGNEVTKDGNPIVYDLDDDFADESPAFDSPVEKRTTKKIKAAELLQKWLRNGPVSVAAIKQRAEAAGISWSTIDKARYEIGLIAAKGTGRGAGWFWLLPK